MIEFITALDTIHVTYTCESRLLMQSLPWAVGGKTLCFSRNGAQSFNRFIKVSERRLSILSLVRFHTQGPVVWLVGTIGRKAL